MTTMLKIAIYPSDHGFGHAARMGALAQEFIGLGMQVRIRSTRPDYLFSCLESPFFCKDDVRNDVGVLHTAGLKADLGNTKASLIKALSFRHAIVEREVNWLRREEISLVIVDVPYLIIEACAYAGIPVIAVTNFDWVFIYARLFKRDIEMRPVINTIHSLYQRCDAAFRLPFSSSASMAAFRSPMKSGLLARRKDRYCDLRELYGIEQDKPILTCTFGGEPGMSVDLKSVCAAWPGMVISASEEVSAANHIHAPRHADWLDLIHGSNVILTKPGYSTFAEATQFNRGIIYLPRQDYPEEEVLIRGLKLYLPKLEVSQAPKGVKAWQQIFRSLPSPQKPHPAFRNQNSRVAADIIGSYLRLRQSSLTSIFDIGSNNLNYLLWDAPKHRILHTAHFTTRLAKLSNPVAVKSLKTSVRKLMACFGDACDAKIVIAASVARENERFKPLSRWFEQNYKTKPIVLKQRQEAMLAYSAAINTLDLSKKPIVVDIGGLSSELIWGLERDHWYGAPLGLLSFAAPASNPTAPLDLSDSQQRASLMSILPSIHNAQDMQLVLTGLTGTFLAAIVNKKSNALPWEFHNTRLSRRQIDQLAAAVAGKVSEDWEPYLQIDTAISILEASLGLVGIIMDKYEAAEIVVCYYGISLGQALKR